MSNETNTTPLTSLTPAARELADRLMVLRKSGDKNAPKRAFLSAAREVCAELDAAGLTHHRVESGPRVTHRAHIDLYWQFRRSNLNHTFYMGGLVRAYRTATNR